MDKKDGMKYEPTGSRKPSTGTSKRVALKVADELGTASLLWLLAKRHKVFLLSLGNAVLVLNWAFPEWTQVVKSII